MVSLPWDTASLVALDAARTPWLDSFFLAITWLGSLWVLLPLSLLLALLLGQQARWREPWRALYLPTALLVASSTTWLLKPLLGRERPQLFDSLIMLPADLSFPSGHATHASVFFIGLWLLLPAHLRLLGLLPAIGVIGLVALSRLYLQVHWLSDVIVGSVLGSGCALLLWLVFNPKRQTHAQ